MTGPGDISETRREDGRRGGVRSGGKDTNVMKGGRWDGGCFRGRQGLRTSHP